jgi:hypothetical protein
LVCGQPRTRQRSIRAGCEPLLSLTQRMESPRLVSEAVAQRTKVAHLPRFLSDTDIEAIHAVAETARAEAEAAGFKVSATYERQVREGARTVWLNHRLAEQLPELHARMLSAARAADEELWGGVLRDREALALRSSEYHTVIYDEVSSPRRISQSEPTWLTL